MSNLLFCRLHQFIFKLDDNYCPYCKKEIANDTQMRKAELDKMTFGSGVVHVSDDGTVKHIPLKDFMINGGD